MNFLLRTGDAIRSLTGRRRFTLAFAAGALSAFGFAPLELFPLLLLGFAVLLLLLDSADRSALPLRTAFGCGWAFAFGQFLIGWHWIGYAFLVDPDAHLWQLPFAVTLLPAGVALFAGVACTLALYFWQDGPGASSYLPPSMPPPSGCAATSLRAFPGTSPHMAGVLHWP